MNKRLNYLVDGNSKEQKFFKDYFATLLEYSASRVPEISESMQIQLVNFVQGIRELDLKKLPAISETIDWAKTVILLNSEELDAKLAEDTLNVLLKHQQDIEVVKKEIPALVSSATETSDGKSLN